MYLLQIFKLNAKFFCILPVFPCLHLDPFCTPLPGYLPGSTTLFVFGFFTGLICCNWNVPSLLIYIFPSLPPVDCPLGVLGCQCCLPHRKLFAMKSYTLQKSLFITAVLFLSLLTLATRWPLMTINHLSSFLSNLKHSSKEPALSEVKHHETCKFFWFPSLPGPLFLAGGEDGEVWELSVFQKIN